VANPIFFHIVRGEQKPGRLDTPGCEHVVSATSSERLSVQGPEFQVINGASGPVECYAGADCTVNDLKVLGHLETCLVSSIEVSGTGESFERVRRNDMRREIPEQRSMR